jgi:hypothetical protein
MERDASREVLATSRAQVGRQTGSAFVHDFVVVPSEERTEHRRRHVHPSTGCARMPVSEGTPYVPFLGELHWPVPSSCAVDLDSKSRGGP